MSDNLTEFLTEVATAIREKKGTQDLINPQDFADEIKSIEGGGGTPTAEWNDVNFYDYEGTILYSYSWNEFVAKNEMPPLPNRESEGLTCQGWNYTLEEVLEQGGRCDVGAIYIPTDGNTHIFVQIKNPTKDVVIFRGVVQNEDYAYIDWGDGESDTYSAGSHKFLHQYKNTGIYEIIISYNKVLTSLDIGHTYYIPAIKMYANRITFGINYGMSKTEIKELTTSNNCIADGLPRSVRHYNCSKTARSYSFLSSTAGNLNTVSIHPKHPTLGGYDLSQQYNLKALHIPTNTIINSVSTNCFNGVIYSCSKKNTNTSVVNQCVISSNKVVLGNRYSDITEGVTSIGYMAFYKVFCININIPDSVETIGASAFRQSAMPNIVKMPKNIKSIEQYAFYEISYVDAYDFSDCITIPILNSTMCFSGSNFKIVVPDTLYDEWISATNWSTYASRIVKASEYVEPTTE